VCVLSYSASVVSSEVGADPLEHCAAPDLFVNLVLGVVVESFSFVYQEYGGVTRISREQMRGFKQVWAQFDPDRSGYLQPGDVGRFLHVRSAPSFSSRGESA